MVVGKFVSKLVQSLPSWEITKYYGRVCWFQIQCLKYRIQTSETWFNLKSKFMPNRLREEAEFDSKQNTEKDGSDKATSVIPKSIMLMQKLNKLRKTKKETKEVSSKGDQEQPGIQICSKSGKGTKKRRNPQTNPTK